MKTDVFGAELTKADFYTAYTQDIILRNPPKGASQEQQFKCSAAIVEYIVDQKQYTPDSIQRLAFHMMHLNTVLKSVGEGFPDLEYSHLLSICQSKVAMFLAKNTEDSITFEYKLNKDDSEEDIVTFTLEKGKVEAQRKDGNVNLNLISGEQQVTMIGKPMENIKLIEPLEEEANVAQVLPFLGFG